MITSFEHWREWSATYTMLPFVIKLPLGNERILSWEKAWEEASPNSFLLESGKGGRYTFLGLAPISIIRGNLAKAEMMFKDDVGNEARSFAEGTPLELVKRWMSTYRAPRVKNAPKFLGGCVGYWGYDVVRTIEKLPRYTASDLPLPDYCFGMYDQIWVIDHQEQSLYAAVHSSISSERSLDESYDLREKYEAAKQKAEAMLLQWDRIVSKEEDQEVRRKHEAYLNAVQNDRLPMDITVMEGIRPVFHKEDFIRAVERIQQYISQGDVFQVNLSVRQSRKLAADPEEIYEWLRIINPSPYMGMLRFSDFALVSASPELLIQLEDGILRTRPIAGTRPRGKNEQEDQSLAQELIHNEKERAEHIMLVDLLRNDLGRISEYGTVKVEDFMVIEKYSHVMHIVSQVEGKLAAGKDPYDVIASTFPGGTITGAPKIRTMEIIEELEPLSRGPYTGSMGWIDYNGNMEFNIIIRTLATVAGEAHIQAGAGIVIDSVPDKEYTESLNKAKAIWKAIEYSEQTMS